MANDLKLSMMQPALLLDAESAPVKFLLIFSFAIFFSSPVLGKIVGVVLLIFGVITLRKIAAYDPHYFAILKARLLGNARDVYHADPMDKNFDA